MNDDPRRASVDATPGAERGHAGQPAPWPPAVPSAIHVRPRSAAAPHPEVRLSSVPAAPAPAAPAPAAPAAPAAAPVAAPIPAPVPAVPAEQAPPPGRDPVDAAAALLLDPAGYRIRLVRDAAAFLTLVVGVVLAGSLLAGAGPTGAVLSATSAPGAAAGDPRGAPGMVLPATPSVDTTSAPPDGGAPPGPTVSAGFGASPGPTPAATLVASAEPAP